MLTIVNPETSWCKCGFLTLNCLTSTLPAISTRGEHTQCQRHQGATPQWASSPRGSRQACRDCFETEQRPQIYGTVFKGDR